MRKITLLQTKSIVPDFKHCWNLSTFFKNFKANSFLCGFTGWLQNGVSHFCKFNSSDVFVKNDIFQVLRGLVIIISTFLRIATHFLWYVYAFIIILLTHPNHRYLWEVNCSSHCRCFCKKDIFLLLRGLVIVISTLICIATDFLWYVYAFILIFLAHPTIGIYEK
jgi:hypothetical protein